jgi:hypothetical protein
MSEQIATRVSVFDLRSRAANGKALRLMFNERQRSSMQNEARAENQLRSRRTG